MNSRERFNSVMNFEVGSRTLYWEMGYWAGTIRRWYKEGLQNQGRILESLPSDKTVTGDMIPSPEFDSPRDVEVASVVGLDKGMMRFPVEHWIYPKFEKTVIEEAETHYYDDPKLTKDILTFLTDFWINLWEKILSYIIVDAVYIWEDMSYKCGSLVSPALFREFMLPCYKRLTGFIKSHGINTIIVDTDGNCTELIPIFMDGGVTGMYPFEVQAGMNVAQIAKDFPTLKIMSGIDKTKLKSKELIDKELEEKVPFVLKRGGYIPSLDHLVPPDVPWELFVYYRNKLNQMIQKNI